MPEPNNTPRMSLAEKLQAMPLLRALVPMAAGVVAGTFLAIPLYVWIIAVVVCAFTAWAALNRTVIANLYVGMAVLFFGAALARVHVPREVVPRGERVWMEVTLTGNPVQREGRRGANTFGVVGRWQADGSTSQAGGLTSERPGGEWSRAGERLLVSVDTVWRFSEGDRVVFRGYVNSIADSTGSYARLMRARGYTGRTYISQYSLAERVAVAGVSDAEMTGAKTGGRWAMKLQSAATERLKRLKVPPDAIGVAAAMTTGDRTGITPELRRAYSRTGASHLLAVSGLHVGIVFLIINALLYLLPLVRGGHIVKNIVAVVVIWLYAALTGLSPSATRAAFMFSGAQIALATSQTRGAANIMCGTAMVMLAVKPGLLFDISFQLSFIAVAAIMAWFSPLYRLVASRFRILNALWAMLVVGFVASLATMPLVSYTFGVFSPVGVVLNPLVITTAYLTVGFSLVWTAAPVPLLEPVFRWLAGGPAWLQNRAVELVAGVPGAAVEWTMPLWAVFVVYAAMLIFTAWLGMRPARETEPFTLPR